MSSSRMDDGAAGGLEAPSAEERFAWIEFYEAVADKLLEHRSDRRELVQGIHRIAAKDIGLPTLQFKNDGERFPVEDVCPFTAMGIFNRRMGREKRSRIMGELADFLGVGIKPPDSLAVGTPLIVNVSGRFFTDKRGEMADHIEALWEAFAAALRFSDSGRHREQFARAHDKALEFRSDPRWANWNLSVGLYWIRPRTFPSLDKYTSSYLQDALGLEKVTKHSLRSDNYLRLRDDLKGRFMRDGWFVGSFPELTAEALGKAWQRQRLSSPPATSGNPAGGSPPRPDAERKAEVSVAKAPGSPPFTPLEDFVQRTRDLPRNTEHECRIVQRIGQDIFRDLLLKFWNKRCPLTGITHPWLLRAGHMKPWNVCDNDERLDAHNGLLLAAHLDAAFDKGLIGFDMDGTLIVSPELSRGDVVRLGLSDMPRLLGLRPEHEPFLAYHRHEIFKGSASG